MRRVLRIISVLDENLLDWEDDGVADREGRPLPRRQRNIDGFGERVVLKTAEGRTRKVQVFLLAEPPTVEDPEFDEKYLRAPNGEWLLPTPEWKELREARISKRAAEREAYSQVQTNVVSNNITAGIRELAKSAVEAASSTPRKVK
jgi:hypothetical protein